MNLPSLRLPRSLLALGAVCALCAPHAAAAAREKAQHEWPGAELPLPLPVRTPQDLPFKAVTERQYLIFNLLAAGKLAYDAADFATAAQKWESLLQLPGLEADIDRAVRPLALDARSKAGSAAARPLPPPPPAAAEASPPPPRRQRSAQAEGVVVEGVVAGGGPAGPGGAVITLKRTDGPMPKIVPQKGKIVAQRSKTFSPRVVAIPVGSSIIFRNEDPIFHNVFSLSPAASFDLGLYKAPTEKEQQFDQPGVIDLLCNIHSSMSGFVVVVDTPFFAQADGAGAFRIQGVVPGEYDLEVWHELSSKPTKRKLTVSKEGEKLSLTVGGDRQPPAFVPDKYGKARQPQLGY